MWPFSTPFDPSTAIPSLAGKVIIVTGGNIGLGQETILQLAKHHPSRIYMASRTESKALAAIKEIKSQLPKSSSDVSIEFLRLNLKSLKSVAAAAESFSSQNTRLDLLILNAGIMATPPGRSESGHDDQLGTNHIGHFLLTKLLLPTLQRTASEPNSDVRVISVSSEAFNMSPSLDVITSTEKLTAKGPWARYGASKAANIMFAAEFARRYPAIKAVSLHPGLIKTQLYQPSSSFVMNVVLGMIQPLMFMDVHHGAQNQLWASAGSKREDVKDGAYYTPVGKLQRENKWANDQKAGRTLWEWTESELAKAGY
jgi:NAD(P)-dependent dehydrogenase (short-subunit alcohol dehydrogenase family)